jgi:hypothetical protein
VAAVGAVAFCRIISVQNVIGRLRDVAAVRAGGGSRALPTARRS